ncbi:MAG: 4-hydroxy-tetrahydrodipicolinate synthase [Aureispira sp.]|nr:4-hydroxy-tetrahydrodipicolinate synthase [Aureispira sp.]
MTNIFRGTGVALVTPFKDGQVDYDALARLIEHCINGGLDYLVSLGTTGESVTLSKKEKIEVLDFTVRQAAGRVKIVGGFGGNNTADVIESIKNYHFEGVDGILSVSPAYSKPTQEGIYQHFMAIEAVAPRPIILYNVPGRTSSNISSATTLRLAHASKKFVAIKEASGNLRQCMDIVKNRPENFAVVSGDDNLTLPMLGFGMDGVISVVANAYPQEFSDMVRAGFANDFETARALHYSLVDLVDLLFVEGNPGGIKAVLEQLGICSKKMRLPLVDISQETYDKLAEQVATLKKPVIA